MGRGGGVEEEGGERESERKGGVSRIRRDGDTQARGHIKTERNSFQ